MKSVIHIVVVLLSVTAYASCDLNHNNICVSESNGTTFKHPESDKKMFICLNRVTFEVSCHGKYYYDEQKSSCIIRDDIVEEPKENSVIDNPCQNIPGIGVIPSEIGCQYFYICVNGDRFLGICPDGAHFDPIRLNCFPKETVNCDISSTTSSTTLTEEDTTFMNTVIMINEETPSNACSGIPDGTLVNNLISCDAFYFCFGGNAIKGHCPPPSLFNHQVGMCDLPENVICPEDETTTIEIETTTESKDECYSLPNFTFLNDPRKCADYFSCYNGQSISKSCPNGFYFNTVFLICARSESVNCTDYDDFESTTTNSVTDDYVTSEEESTEESTTTEQFITTDDATTTVETTSPLPVPKNCPSNGIIIIPNPQRCSQFHLCVYGIEKKLACPAGQHFVISTDSQCEPREIANCTIPLPECDPDISAQQVQVLAHPQYCERFFLCLSGYMIPLECEEDQHFNIDRGQCTTKEIAKCESV